MSFPIPSELSDRSSNPYGFFLVSCSVFPVFDCRLMESIIFKFGFLGAVHSISVMLVELRLGDRKAKPVPSALALTIGIKIVFF